MKVHVSQDDMWTIRYDTEKSEYRKRIDVPEELIAEYDAALAAYEVAAGKLWAFAEPIYEAREAEARAKILSRPPFQFKRYEYVPPKALAEQIEQALFNV